MALLKSKPTSPGKRGEVRVVHKNIHKGRPHAPLLESISKTGGRNNHGRITVRHIGGGSRNQYRLIDFKRTKDGIPAKVERIESSQACKCLRKFATAKPNLEEQNKGQ